MTSDINNELKEIHTEYVDDIKALHMETAHKILSYSRFCWLLKVAFKHVKIREYRSVRNSSSKYVHLFCTQPKFIARIFGLLLIDSNGIREFV